MHKMLGRPALQEATTAGAAAGAVRSWVPIALHEVLLLYKSDPWLQEPPQVLPFWR